MADEKNKVIWYVNSTHTKVVFCTMQKHGITLNELAHWQFIATGRGYSGKVLASTGRLTGRQKAGWEKKR